jgi:hypothetical protein
MNRDSTATGHLWTVVALVIVAVALLTWAAIRLLTRRTGNSGPGGDDTGHRPGPPPPGPDPGGAAPGPDPGHGHHHHDPGHGHGPGHGHDGGHGFGHGGFDGGGHGGHG